MEDLIFIDIDEVTANTVRDWVYPVVNVKYGTHFSHETTTDYRDVFWNEIIENGIIVDTQRKIQIFNKAILTDKWKNLIQPVQWSVEKILELSNWWANLWNLTARHPMLTEYTSEWVKHYFKWHIWKILFSNCYHWGKVTKADICKQEWVRIMIEDDMDYSLELAKNWIKVFLLSKPWNIHRKEKNRNIIKVDSWYDIVI